MSLLDMDERAAGVLEHRVRPFPVNGFQRVSSPLRHRSDRRWLLQTKITYMFYGNSRENCDVLVAIGQCAIVGGLPVMRNAIIMPKIRYANVWKGV